MTPVLTLPESFQSAYVGEEFSCTVCANNELPPEDNGRSISAVRVEAEMQAPSGKNDIPLELTKGTDAVVEGKSYLPGDSIQKIIRLNLNEPGQHVLAVTVTYTETQLSDGEAAGGRVRTFRKLYQFKATTLIGVKTKAGDVKVKRAGLERYALEAQLENLGERTVTLGVRYQSSRSQRDDKSDDFNTGRRRYTQSTIQELLPELGYLWYRLGSTTLAHPLSWRSNASCVSA